ncbi:MAG: ester cyclase [Alphaproteobacteria bacterium]
MDRHTHHKALLAPLRAAQYNFEESQYRATLEAVCAPDALFRMAHPLGEIHGTDAFYNQAVAPLVQAWPDVERRDYIVMAGTDSEGGDWVGCGGLFMGVSLEPWLDIPPTGHLAHMRFHEFFRFVGGKVVEMQSLWDIPEVMMQAGAWPMPPSLGREMTIPAPASQDGLIPGPYDAAASEQSKRIVLDMIEKMILHPGQSDPAVMELERFWHPKFNWYGPSGIGSSRGIAGFRNWHQIPFLKAMPDRGKDRAKLRSHFFGDGNYAGVTGWPNMVQTLSDDGWMGLAPSGTKFNMKSLDFWRVEDGLIRENWVMIDVLECYAQLGVDVFARLGEFNKTRNMGRIPLPTGMEA